MKPLFGADSCSGKYNIAVVMAHTAPCSVSKYAKASWLSVTPPAKESTDVSNCCRIWPAVWTKLPKAVDSFLNTTS